MRERWKVLWDAAAAALNDESALERHDELVAVDTDGHVGAVLGLKVARDRPLASLLTMTRQGGAWTPIGEVDREPLIDDMKSWYVGPQLALQQSVGVLAIGGRLTPTAVEVTFEADQRRSTLRARDGHYVFAFSVAEVPKKMLLTVTHGDGVVDHIHFDQPASSYVEL